MLISILILLASAMINILILDSFGERNDKYILILSASTMINLNILIPILFLSASAMINILILDSFGEHNEKYYDFFGEHSNLVHPTKQLFSSLSV